MSTRGEVCLTWLNGGPCDQLGADRASCALMRCCGSGEPSKADYRAARSSLHRGCPHPSGDRWAIAGAEIEPTPAEDFAASRIVALVVLRIRQCTRPCEEFVRPLDCRIEGPLNAKLTKPEFACPRQYFAAEAV